jgi:transketolase
VKQSETDVVTVIGGGVTLHEALKAAEQLAGKGVNIRVIDPFTIKPIDAEAIVKNARATKGRVITVEDHYPEGNHVLFSISCLNRAIAGFSRCSFTQIN